MLRCCQRSHLTWKQSCGASSIRKQDTVPPGILLVLLAGCTRHGAGHCPARYSSSVASGVHPSQSRTLSRPGIFWCCQRGAPVTEPDTVLTGYLLVHRSQGQMLSALSSSGASSRVHPSQGPALPTRILLVLLAPFTGDTLPTHYALVLLALTVDQEATLWRIHHRPGHCPAPYSSGAPVTGRVLRVLLPECTHPWAGHCLPVYFWCSRPPLTGDTLSCPLCSGAASAHS